MLSQEKKEEVDGNPPISHALSSQLLLWRQDSASARLLADLERREVTARAPQGAQRDTDDGQVGGEAALTWGRACTTVSSRARIPVAIFKSFSTVGNTQPGPLSPDQRGQACACVCV